MSITNITNLLRGVQGHPRTVFDRLFDVAEYTGELVLPAGIRDWVAEKFGDPAGVERQHIVRVTNRVTLEGTLFNALRALRPLAAGDPAALDRLVAEHLPGCAFCRPGDKTPADTFGRLAGGGAVTASNVAKYDRWHGLIIPEEHHPLRFDPQQVAGYFALAGDWFRRVLEQPAPDMEDRPRFPFLMWNCLWPAGSSIVHGHLQVTVTPGMHYPRVEHLRRSASAYRERYGSDYFDDLFLAHRVAGLALKSEEVRVFASLTPLKEKETWVLLPGKSGLQHLEELGLWVGRVLACLRETGTTSFNVAAYIPPPEPGQGQAGEQARAQVQGEKQVHGHARQGAQGRAQADTHAQERDHAQGNVQADTHAQERDNAQGHAQARGQTQVQAQAQAQTQARPPEDWSGFPLIARVVDRGPATGRTADFGGMELYAASVVSADPYEVARILRPLVPGVKS